MKLPHTQPLPDDLKDYRDSFAIFSEEERLLIIGALFLVALILDHLGVWK